MNKQKVGILIAAAVVAVAAVGGGIWYFLRGNSVGGSSADKVYVESVEKLTTAGTGVQNRYSGVVEPQETWEVNKNTEKKVKEKFVKEGDSVEVGTPLFEYDTEDLKAELSQAQLELEGMSNEISNFQAQIKQLTEERKSASEDDKFQYTAEIQTIQNSIKQSEFNIEGKKIEIQKKQQSVDNAKVTSEIAGVVKTINEAGMDPMTGQAAAYMTILATGAFRVKGTISEQTVGMVSEGQKVILRSRIKEDQTWTGTISKIDLENQQTNEGNNYSVDISGGSGNTQTSTKYPFYVALENVDGLILGQHVYIELDEGQTEQKEGLWLFEGYLVMDDKEPYVWALNKKNRLEKRKVTLGEYDENLGEYEIVSGLRKEDSIAFPMEGLYEGVSAVTDMSEVDYSSPLYQNQNEGVSGTVEEIIEQDPAVDPDGGFGVDGDMAAPEGESGSNGAQGSGEGGTDPGTAPESGGKADTGNASGGQGDGTEAAEPVPAE